MEANIEKSKVLREVEGLGGLRGLMSLRGKGA